MSDGKAYVYVHYRESDGLPFYVGKGSCPYRYTQKTGRNKYWQRTAAKHGFRAEIIADGMSDKDAFDLEVKTISEMRASGQPIVNITAGGEGASGYMQTPEHIAKRVSKRIGQKWSKESRDRVKGRKKSAETRKKLSEAVRGFRHTEEAKRKISEAQTGRNHHLYDAVVREFRHPEHGIVWATQNELAKRFDLHKSNLCSIIMGRKKTCSGWTYIGVHND